MMLTMRLDMINQEEIITMLIKRLELTHQC